MNDSLVVRNLLPATSSVIFLEYDIHEKQSKNIGSAQHADSDMSESNCYGKHCNGKDEGWKDIGIRWHKGDTYVHMQVGVLLVQSSNGQEQF